MPSLELIPGILPPSRETWETVVTIFKFFPIFTGLQWVIDWYPMGKTSITSPLNLPGKWAWFFMEIPGFLIVLHSMFAIPELQGLTEPLPWGNWTMAGLFTIHYVYRAILSPLLLNPSMSPIHPIVFLSAFGFQVMNGLSIGGWVGGYGPTTAGDWAGRMYQIQIGMVIWGWSLLGNIFHDDDLREIRRSAARRQKEASTAATKKEGKVAGDGGAAGVDKLYMMPKNGLFHYVLYPHYLCEWVEWGAFWMIGGWDCVPARSFIVNEIATMLPRALSGRRWYIEKFGKERVGNRKAVIPGIL